ncbi:hypothetical protein ACF0H5_008433 [Mactra antiquata]
MSASNESKQTPGAKSSDDGSSVDVSKVHSANSWETADLGDDDRKKKFLRLMGASKEGHQGKFVIGDKESSNVHSRDKKQTEQIEKELEDQYRHTFEHRITKWSHKGLGFDDEKKEVNESSNTTGESENKTDSDNVKNTDNKEEEKTGQKRESTEPVTEPQSPPKKPKMMMNFVKASD